MTQQKLDSYLSLSTQFYDVIRPKPPEEKLSHANDLKKILDNIHENIRALARSKPATTKTAPYALSESRSTIKVQIESPAVRPSIPTFEPFCFENNHQVSCPQLADFHHQCLENQDKNPIWVIESIQDLMSRLPLPRKIPDTTFQDYSHLSAEETDQILNYLREIRTIYLTCRNRF